MKDNECLYIPRFDARHANAELRKKDGEWYWVRMPTSMDSLSRKRLMQTPEGREAFTVYIHLVELAAKDPPRGLLADERGPFDLIDISLKTDMPQGVIKKGLALLQSARVGWVSVREWNENEIPDGAVHSSYSSSSNSCSTENKPDLFDEFWNQVPNKIGKGKARDAYANAIRGGATHDQIVAGLESYRQYEARREKQPDYRPLHPATWLNGERWTDELVIGSTSKSKANAAAWESLGPDTHRKLLEAVQASEPDVDHRAANTETHRAMRKLAKQRGLL